MKKNMKGFTLIELLAVIVILAVIALIATPIIMNVINEAKVGADRDGAYGVVKAIETSIAQEMVKDQSYTAPVTCDINSTGKACGSINIDFKGTNPKGGTINLTNGKVENGSKVEMPSGVFTIGTDGKFGDPVKK